MSSLVQNQFSNTPLDTPGTSAPAAPSYLINTGDTPVSKSAADSVSVTSISAVSKSSAAPQNTTMADPYSSYLNPQDVIYLEGLAYSGYWDEVKSFIQLKIDQLHQQAANASDSATANTLEATADQFQQFLGMNNSQINQVLFGSSGQLNPNNLTNIYSGYTPSASDSVGTIIEGNRHNLINTMLDEQNYITPVYTHVMQAPFNQYFSHDEVMQLQGFADANDLAGMQNLVKNKIKNLQQQAFWETDSATANTMEATADQLQTFLDQGQGMISNNFQVMPTGYFTFNENRWSNDMKQLQRWNNLMAVLAKLQTSINESVNIVNQEMIQQLTYKSMNLEQMVQKENAFFTKFAGQQVRQYVDTVSAHNQFIYEKEKAQAQKILNDPATEMVISLFGFVANIVGLVLTLGVGAPVIGAITQGVTNTAIQKLTSEDDVAYQKRLAEIEEQLAQARETQNKQAQKEQKEIEQKRKEYQKALAEGQATEIMMVEALQLSIDLGVDSINSANFVGITANGYQELARGKVLLLQAQLQSLLYVMEFIQKIEKERKNAHGRVHQEMTGVKGYKSGSLEANVTAQSEELLKTFQRKLGYLQETVSSFNQARQSYENAKAAEATLVGRISNSILTSMFGVLSPLTGNYYLGVFNGGISGYLNYQTTKNVNRNKRNNDPGNVTHMSDGSAANLEDFNVDSAVSSLNPTGNDLSGEIQTLVNANMQNLNTAIVPVSKNRLRFDQSVVAIMARKIETMRRIERAYTTLKQEQISAHGRVHSQMSEGSEDYEVSDTAQKIVGQKFDMYTQAYQQKSASMQEKIQAHNQMILVWFWIGIKPPAKVTFAGSFSFKLERIRKL